jgi:ribosomal protein L21E
MPGGQGYRARTRDMFKRGYRQAGFINLSTYLRTYKLGDYVDIKVNGAVQKVGYILERQNIERLYRNSKTSIN